MSAWIIYLVSLADCLKGAACLLAIVLFSLLVATLVVAIDCPENNTVRKCAYILGIALPFAAIIAIFTPNTKTIAAMYVLPKICNSENVQKFSDACDLAIERMK